ncbi:hypothetical protein [Polaromonas sp. LjRoot131]|uniref:hypothetical protein n=1 Tax=Polaromonas sp. LjRoot131 TaxID=3342262 RepID=UPI003ECC6DF5
MEITGTYGRYYYRENLSDLVLVSTNSLATEWQESDSKGKQTGRAYFNCEPGKLQGIWMSADESKTLSINAVSSTSYDARRTARLPLKVRKTQTWGSRSIDTVFVNGIPSLNSLRLRGEGPGIQRVNRLLQKDLADNVNSHLRCVAGSLATGRFEDPWGDELDQQAVFWAGDVLSVQTSYGGYCGGAHPYHGQSYQTYDTSTGKAIPIANWLDTAYRKKVDLESTLGKMIKAKLLGGKKSPEGLPTDERECVEEALTKAAYITAIEKQGIGFSFPFSYAMSPCQLDHFIPWTKMRPFLSEEGKRLLNEIERN